LPRLDAGARQAGLGIQAHSHIRSISARGGATHHLVAAQQGDRRTGRASGHSHLLDNFVENQIEGEIGGLVAPVSG
jgi:hypothetical protein